ncbi:MAG: hypothetical protein JO033_19895 [Acidobacteriaceae bacterium]|nr:hypothetical protein [Acidobacteriaceae bacterium]MBV9498294.1 hypothetical protein [Acidobacteriaceae bacterium]
MLNQIAQRLSAVLLLLICPPALLMAERPSAMLYAEGSVTINDTPAAKSTGVFDGDRINTAAASVVSINRSGSSLVVDPNSSLEYRNDGFTIEKGMVRVRTSKGMTAHWGSLSVIPKTGPVLFDVSTDGTTVLVTSREGSLTLTDGIETATVEPGYTAKVSVDSQQDQQQGPKPAATTRGEPSNHKKLIIILLAAAGAAAIACILACGVGAAAPATPTTP